MAAPSAGSYLLGWAGLAVLAFSLTFSAVQVRRRLLPAWEGAPAHLVDAIAAVALLIWISELLGFFNLLYAWTVVPAAVLLAAAIAVGSRMARGGGAGESLGSSPGESAAVRDRGRGEEQDAALPRHPLPVPSAGGTMTVVAVGAVAVVFAHWGVTTADALGRGIFNFDSLWYHMPFAVEMAHSHSVTGIHYTETVFTNWFYPQNSELLHAIGILLTQRDTLSLFLNFGWLAIAFLAAWCIGRPYGRGPLTVVAAAVVLECHTLVVREPGAGKNDLMAAALLLAAIAILVNAFASGGATRDKKRTRYGRRMRAEERTPDGARSRGPVGWPLAVAGLAAGMAVGTKSTAVAMAAILTVAVVALAPAGRRWAATGWWLLSAFAGGGFWYGRNLILSGNPLPQLERLGPLALPHPERLQSGRPDFSIAHYATDTAVWRDYFGPGLEQAFGALWPLVIAGAIAGGAFAVLRGRERVLRWMGVVALFGLVAYLFTPLSAAGAEGKPVAFAINIRYAIPALLAGLALLPLALHRLRAASSAPPPAVAGGGSPPRDGSRGPDALSWVDWTLLGALLVVLVVTNRADAVLRDPDRLFAWLLATVAVLVPAALLVAWRRGAPRGAVAAGVATLIVAVVAIGYPVQRDYLQDRFANENPDTSIPDMHLSSAYRWARGVDGARIGLAGTTAGFLQYGFYGPALSNRVRYLGLKAPHGGFRPIPDCRRFREAVNDADLDYLVTAPFLNFISPDRPIMSPEAGWLQGEGAVEPIVRSGEVTVWRVKGALDPARCGPANAPLRRIPQQPVA